MRGVGWGGGGDKRYEGDPGTVILLYKVLLFYQYVPPQLKYFHWILRNEHDMVAFSHICML